MVVYSTDKGRLCPVCEKPIETCVGHASTKVGDGRVLISRESKGRGGKSVTLIKGLPLNETELRALAKKLKKQCGVGGSTVAGDIVIQGDQRQALMAELLKLGYEAKFHGG